LTMRQLSASGAPLQSAAFSHFDPVGVACVLYISNLLDPMPELSHPWTEKKVRLSAPHSVLVRCFCMPFRR